jgi:hypothetical protein
MMKKLMMVLLMVAALVTAAQADVYVVSDTGKGGDPEAAAMVAWLQARFWTQLGTITVDEFYTTADIPAAGADDLVIFLRTLNNGAYDETGEPAAWNALAAPILMLNPFQPDDDNLGWVTTTAQNEILSSPVGAETLTTVDSLFDGVTVDGSGYADLITDGISYKTNPTDGFDASEVVGTTTLTTAGDSIVLARIAAGTAWDAGANGTGTHGGDRIVFNFLRNPGDMTDLTADGQTVLANAISELTGATPKPANATNLAPTGLFDPALIDTFTWDNTDFSGEPNWVSTDSVSLDYVAVLNADIDGDDPNWLEATTISPATSPVSVTFDYATTYFWRVNTVVTWDSNEITGAASATETLSTYAQGYADVQDHIPTANAPDDYVTWEAIANTTVVDVNNIVVDDGGDGDITSVVFELLQYPGQVVDEIPQMKDRSDAARVLLAELEPAYDPNLLIDWIGTDTYANGDGVVQGGDPMTLTLSGLPASTSYTWQSVHHDGGSQAGDFTASISGATTDSIDAAGIITDANNVPVPFNAAFTTDGLGSDVQLVFAADAESRFFLMNGFTLDTVPTSGAPLKVDFSADVNDLAVGYLAYQADDEVPDTFVPQDFSAFATTVTITPTWYDAYVDGSEYTITLTPDLTDILAPEVTFLTSWTATGDEDGVFKIGLTATDAAANEATANLYITVYDDACEAAQNAATWDGYNTYDNPDRGGNGNCIVDLPDFAGFALQWLDDVNLTGPAVK